MDEIKGESLEEYLIRRIEDIEKSENYMCGEEVEFGMIVGFKEVLNFIRKDQ